MTEAPTRALLADDEQGFALTTSEVLKRHGIDCDWVSNSEEALAALSDRVYDVLVADIKMPGNDELGLFETLREERDGPAVILITGYPSVDTAVRSVDLGAYAYIIKPFELNEFVDKVREAARQTALRRQVARQSHAAAELQQRLETLREDLERRSTRDLDQTACDYMGLLLNNVGQTVMEASELICLMQEGGDEKPLRQLAEHPEADMLRNAVDETVQTLERTKRSFRSKELAQLRKRLERLLELTENKRGEITSSRFR